MDQKDLTNPISSMNFQLVFFQPWHDGFPLNIYKQDTSGGFFKVGPRSFTLYRPQIALQQDGNRIVAASTNPPGTVLWRGETDIVSDPLDRERHPIQQFHQPLLVQGDKVLVLVSGQDVYVQQGKQQGEKIQLRGIASVTEGEFQLAVRRENALHLLPPKNDPALLSVGPEKMGEGPWTLYAHTPEGLFVANHQQLRTYGSNGELIREVGLTDSVYENELFPPAYHISSVAGESLSSVLIAFTGPDGYGIGRFSW